MANKKEDFKKQNISFFGIFSKLSSFFIVFVELMGIFISWEIRVYGIIAVVLIGLWISSVIMWHKKNFRVPIAIRMLWVSCFMIACFFAYQNCITVENYNDISERYGLGEGVGACLNENGLNERANYWCVKENSLFCTITVELMTNSDVPALLVQASSMYQQAPFALPAKIVYKYRYDEFYGKKVVEEATYYDFDARKIMQLHYPSPTKMEVVFLQPNKSVSILKTDLFDRKTINALPLTNVAEFEIKYSKSGFPETRVFVGNKMTRNYYGSNGEQYTYNANNQLECLYYLDDFGMVTANSKGIAAIDFTYEASGRISRLRFYSDAQKKNLTPGYNGINTENFHYDIYDNLVESVYTDATAKGQSDTGVEIFRYTYVKNTANKQVVNQEAYFSQNQDQSESVSVNRLSGLTFKNYQYDKRTNKFLISYRDKEDASFQLQDIRNENKSNDLVFTESAMFSDLSSARKKSNDMEKDLLCLGTMQHIVQAITPNRKGNAAKIEYLAQNEEPYMCNNGYAFVKMKYDKYGNVKEESYYDTQNKLCIQKNGYAVLKRQSNKDGQIVDIRYYDTAKKATPNIATSACIEKIRFSAYNNGEWTRNTFYYNEKNEPCSTKEGYYGMLFRYDENENCLEQSFYDSQGKLMFCFQQGYAKQTQIYEKNRLIRREFRDAAENLINYKNYGYAVLEKKYDLRGNVTEQHFLDENENLTLHSDTGFAILKVCYNEKNQQENEAYFDTDKKPIVHKTLGCVSVDMKYDSKGNRVEYRYLDKDGNLTLRSDTGCAILKYQYNEKNQKESEAYFGTDASPILHKKSGYAQVRYDYDMRGNCIEYRYLDENENLTLRSDTGYAILKYHYNEKNQCDSAVYLGTDENPILNKEYDCAEIRWYYDTRGNCTEYHYLDENGNLTLRSDTGFAILKCFYNEKDQNEKETYLGIDEKPVIRKDLGCISMTMKYDSRGNCTEYRYWDENGNLTLRSDTGFAILKYHYNEKNQCDREEYLGMDESPILHEKYGYAEVRYDYDTRGNCTEYRYLDESGNLTLGNDMGYAILKFLYNEKDEPVTVEYYNEYEQVIDTPLET